MSDCQFANFDITIRGDRNPYPLTAFYAGRSADGDFDQDVSREPWPTLLYELSGLRGAPGHARILSAGRLLYESLMRDDVRDLWIGARSQVEARPEQGLRIRLALQPPPVAALPWEALYDADRNLAFAVDQSVLLVRAERTFRHIGIHRPLAVRPPVKLLLAAPEDPAGQLDADAEIARVRGVLASAAPGLAEVSELRGRFDALKLGDAIADTQPDILHLIAHGEADGLLLWQDDEPALISTNSLRVVLAQSPSVKLVFLNSCLTGRSSAQRSFDTVGPQLLQTGVPAVIAMQFVIRDSAAAEFSAQLYAALLTGPCRGAIDVAVAQARSALYVRNPDDFSFGTPVIWLNSDDGRILRFDALPEADDGDQATPAVAVQELDIAATEVWLGETLRTLPSQPPFHLRSVRNDCLRLAEELRQMLRQLRHLRAQPATPQLARQTNAKIDEIQEQRLKIQRLHTILMAHLPPDPEQPASPF